MMTIKTILLLLLPAFLYCQNADENLMNARRLTELAHNNFRVNPKKSIVYGDSAAKAYKSLGNLRWQAISLQNIAFAYDEGLNELDSAYYYMSLAKDIFINMKDSNGLANNLKYIGLLEGKLGRLTEARSDIYKAIELFKGTGFTAGVAVSYFDLAGLYEIEGKLDSSLIYYEMNRSYFSSNSDKPRVFIATTKILQILFEKGDYNQARNEFKKNWKLKRNKDVNPQNLLEFYKTCIPFLEQLGQKDKLKKIEASIMKIENQQ